MTTALWLIVLAGALSIVYGIVTTRSQGIVVAGMHRSGTSVLTAANAPAGGDLTTSSGTSWAKAGSDPAKPQAALSAPGSGGRIFQGFSLIVPAERKP